MSPRYDTDDDLQDLHDSRGQDREISLGIATILGIFFALALLCAVFFGFGYGLGRRSAVTTSTASDSAPATSESGASKPAPGSPATRPTAVAPATQSGETSSPSSDPPTATSEDAPVKAVSVGLRPDTHIEQTAKPAVRPAAATAVLSTGPGEAIVQVAAVSHQEDADVLLTALKRRGYNVVTHHEPQDKLLHVQIGPFANKKDADAMRQRLQTDGYNAIVK